MLRAFAFGLIFVCISCTEALACLVPSLEQTIIFDDPPTSLDAPVIAEVTITDMSEAIDPSNGWVLAVMNARVEKVIRGSIDSKALKIVTYLSDCSRVGVGHGIVAGELRRGAKGDLELMAVQESGAERDLRKAREQAK
jgi:hypothetical protein